MKASHVILILTAACLVSSLTAVAWSAEGHRSEGQVIAVQEWVLYTRTTNEPMSFSPYWTFDGKVYVPSLPARTVLPALESGERVAVTWTLDEREGRRRIDSIEILSPREGTTKGTVVSSSVSQLVIRPKDEPGTVTLNPQMKKVENRWVPDQEIANKLRTLTKGSRVTVQWRWDDEGRKRIVGLVIDRLASAARSEAGKVNTYEE